MVWLPQHVTFSSSNDYSSKFSSLGQLVMTSKIQGWLSLLCNHHDPIAPRGIRCGRDFSLARPTQLYFGASQFWSSFEPLHKFPVSSFQLGRSRPQIFCNLTSELQGLSLCLPRCFLPAIPGRTILPDCSVEHFSHLLSWLPQGQLHIPLLFKSFLFRTQLKIVLLCHMIEGPDYLSVIWSIHSPKTHST